MRHGYPGAQVALRLTSATQARNIDKFVKDGNVNVYGEEAFNNISDKLKLYAVYYGDEFCMEIDNFEELEIARKFFKCKIRSN